MRLPGELLAGLEIALARGLAQDPSAREQLARLAGRSLAVHLNGLDIDIGFTATASGLAVSDAPPADADVKLSGGLREFARVLAGGDAVAGGVRIEGDALLAQSFARILQRAEFDPEDWLAARIGDVPAHLAGRLFREGAALVRRAADTLSLDVAEYLREETRDLVHREDVAEWTRAVDTLRADADRLGARMRRLAGRLVRHDPPGSAAPSTDAPSTDAPRTDAQ